MLSIFLKNKKVQKFGGLLLGLILLSFGTFKQILGTSRQPISEPGLTELFHTVMYHVKNEFVEKSKAEDLWFGAIRGMLNSLDDPHTRFMTPDEYNELQVETRGNFGGLGIEISVRDNVLIVVSPIEGTPAMRAGILPGDRIIEINNKETKKLNVMKAVKQLRGTPGTSVTIAVARKGEDELLKFDIVREIIKIKVVEATIIKNKKIGYIKLKQFSQNAYSDMVKVVKKFKKKKIKAIILDLRWNPGGLLDAAHKIANIFIKTGVIVSTRGRKKHLDRTYPAIPGNALLPKMPLVILANEGSASASEIVTGAVKDLKRGVFIGTKTFGKGSVQNVIPLSYNTAIALTIQKYYTPSGISIHKIGIKPDIEVKALEFSRKDRKNYRKIEKKKLLFKFVEKHKEYTTEAISMFKKLIKKKGLKLSNFAASYSLKQEINKGKKRPLYDLEFDVQLKRAIKELQKI